MGATSTRHIDLLVLAAVTVLIGALFVVPIEYAPIVLAVAAGGGLFVAWCTTGRLVLAVVAWFILVVCFDEEFWRVSVPLFFNVTFSRIFIVVLAAAWASMWLMGRTSLRSAGKLLPIMAAILLYFTGSAIVAGFHTVAPASVHYRLFGGYWFAFAMFFLLLHAVRRESDIRLLLAGFSIIGVYLAFTGWCEHFHVWSLVFPRYIADPSVGIHWGRVRGPFVVSATMGLAMLFCTFANFLLARRCQGPARWFFWLISLAMLPPIFWTQTRSVWLGFLVAAAIWIGFGRYRRSKTATVAVLAALALVVLVGNIHNFASSERSRGGVSDTEPIYLRIGLALITWDMFQDRPVLGSGFGHFRDVAPHYARDVSSPYFSFGSLAMEHNSFLSLLADTGLVGLGLYLILLAGLLRMSIRLYRVLPADGSGWIGRETVILYWALFGAWVVDGMFRETSVHPFTNSLFFGMSGMIAGMAWLVRQRTIQAVPETLARKESDAAALPTAVQPNVAG